ncbi:hypothetical protein, partial [Planomicrobium sp. MB-3u-38]|uniref:hypothetical protein n=1 Tax=Planomicrobium sp. MB-3u-38 TaxID=2058318 RepID=UPI001303F6C0
IYNSMSSNLDVSLENIKFKLEDENNEVLEDVLFTKEIEERSEQYRVANNKLEVLKKALNIDRG